MLGHLLGMFALQADPDERTRQITTARDLANRSGELRLAEMTALQVREHADLTVEELRRALRQDGHRGLAARRALPAEVRAVPYDSEPPGEGLWTVGHLFDVIHTRDPWLHRVDIADVVADWAGRHQRPLTLDLTGSAGATFVAGTGGPHLQLDAVEFCRTLSGREPGTGLLATPVVF